jgi:Tol biopolymer transport system component
VRGALAVGFLVFALVGANASAVPASDVQFKRSFLSASQWSPNGRWIAFRGGDIQKQSLYVIRPDGTGRRMLITLQSRRSYLQFFEWSPDSTRLATQAGGDILVVGLNGSRRRIQAAEFGDWSPNGRRLLYTSLRRRPGWVVVSTRAGSERRRLFLGTDPDWAPNGRGIAFSGIARLGAYRCMRALTWDRGRGVRQLGPNFDAASVEPRASDWAPQWSADSKLVALIGHIGRCSRPEDPVRIRPSDLTVSIVADDGRRRIVRLGLGNRPRWSPKGSKIVFERRWAGYSNIWIADARGRTVQVSDAADPSWAPDGRRLAFNGTDGIEVVNADGTSRRLLIRNGGRPEWSPRGNLILFKRPVSDACEETYVIRTDGTGLRKLVGC